MDRSRNIPSPLKRCLAAIALAPCVALSLLTTTGCGRQEPAATVAPDQPIVGIIAPSLAPWHPDISAEAWQTVHEWAYDRARSRQRGVPQSSREAREFGPWTAAWEPDLTEAPEDGSLAEWDTLYYVTHSWSAFGQDILGMQPGDTVTVNEQTVLVEGIFDYPKESILNEIILLVGDATVFQTCVPGEDYNRIVYGWPAS